MRKKYNINSSGKVVNDKFNNDNRCLDNHSDLTDRNTIKKLNFPDFIDSSSNFRYYLICRNKIR